MDADRYATIKHLYHEALARTVGERTGFLSQACGGDDALRAEVESLLAHDGQGDFLITPAAMLGDTGANLIGRHVGPYVISARLGEGGMGEVYRARDTKLGRDVAIKVLPAVFTSDPERLARFEREARLLAALNHPNIATIHGVERTGGVPALVLELIEGDTLAERIQRGPITVRDALPIARQIVEALDASHEKGIIHRDLKPANIKITRNGVVKVLDFGLAKAARGDPAGSGLSQSPTITVTATRDGVLLGTTPYMSPEQARGESVDKRTDIWAFGCVLYEMLTGRPAFVRPTITDTLAAIVEREPHWEALPPNTPAVVQRLLTRCLDKEPKRRLRDIGEARVTLEETAFPETPAAERGAKASSHAQRALALAATLIIVAIAAGVVFEWQSLRPSPKRPRAGVARFAITLGAPDWLGLERPTMVLSPDGSRLVYLERPDAGARLYLRALDQTEGNPLPGTEGGTNPFFSPDGESIGFFAGGKLKTLSLGGGGTAVDIATIAASPVANTWVPRGATWVSSGSIVLGSINGSGLWQVPASGGVLQPLVQSSTDARDLSEAWPEALPDGKSVLLTVVPAGQNPAVLAVASLVTGEHKNVIEGSSGHYVSTGHLVYMRGSSLMGVRFDLGRLEVISPPVVLLDDIQQSGGATQFSVSRSGSLVYVRAAGTSQARLRHLLLVDRRGQAEQIAPPPRPYEFPRVSPDGRRIAVHVIDSSNAGDVWLHDLRRATWSQLTFNGKSSLPVWTPPDGQRVTFLSRADGSPKLFWKAADGSGAEELLSSEPGSPHTWSPDGQWLIRMDGSASSLRLFSIADRKSQPFLPTNKVEIHAPAFSPDGHWVAYVSDESGRDQVYVRAFPATEGSKWRISDEGGTQPMWARVGHELFYRNGDRMMAVDIMSSTSVFSAGKPKLLFEGHYESPAARANYDVIRDGHFVMVKAAEQQSTRRQLNVVVNWSEELEARLPGK